jgi:hypothetical protein
MKKLLALLPFLAFAAATSAACSSAPPAADDTAQVSASVTAVPTGVACIAINAGVAEEPLVTERFTVTAGQSTTLSMTGLPSGAVTFSAFAYPTACASVTGTSTATWVSEPMLATLASQSVTSLELVLRPAGSATIGVTFTSCPQGEGSCDGTTCVTLTTDPNNCGACGNVCPVSHAATGTLIPGVCAAGACALPAQCTAPTSQCPSGCTSLQSDVNNCGSCGNACPSTHSATGAVLAPGICVAGSCELQCATGSSQCPSGCVNLQTDVNNCGSCGNVCVTTHSPTGAVLEQGMCVAGSCAQQCTAPTTQCPSGCVNLQTDVSNCGACGNACEPTESASGKITAAACAAGSCN